VASSFLRRRLVIAIAPGEGNQAPELDPPGLLSAALK